MIRRAALWSATSTRLTNPAAGVQRLLAFALAISAIPGIATAGGVQTLEVVEITAKADDLIGQAGTASEGTVTAQQLENRPLLRPAEVLEVVPGLIISQHSGDGKANQYYLRGFNLDHGTDFATTLMGMPANMPTHAHGQGYSDLQFLIPELVERMQYRKGPYAANVGDFATAGSASIDYFRKLDSSFADITAGSYGYRRGLVAGSPQMGDGNLLYALEWTENQGPWTLPEDLGKLNGLLRYSQGTRDNGWSLAAMAYQAKWSSSDQVPQRAIDQGLISRYGNLDPTDGGKTHRYSLSGEWSLKGDNRWTRANAFMIDYDLNLWSNFTFCLSDIALTGSCNRGDQFEQADRRKVYGFNVARTWYEDWLGKAADFTLGVQSRYDDIGNVGLYATTARQRWGTVRQDKVKEGNLSLYGESQVQWQEKFRSILGLREDFYSFDVTSNTPQNSGSVRANIASPKLALIFGPWDKTEYYVNAGYGFHSNDARGVTVKVNPDFRDTDPATGFGKPADPSTPLVRAKGYELGVRSAIVPRLQTSLALWRLDLASELVFAGDAGTTEPSFPSRRMGIEWANYWTPASALTIDADFAVSRARYTTIDATVPGDYIPGAIEKTASIGVSYDDGAKWSGGVRLRYFGPRPLIEDNSVRSPSSTLVSLRIGYKADRNLKLALDVLNLFDRKVSDIDYYYASQLRNEATPVDDIHTHPSEPRSLRLSLRLGF
ncbi:MAG TPA: TonB-dependent receptor [Rhodocyclaceae bacterium]|nr:TonB-dependent receptor [Rhodocyclaceae bacterium]